eukprot:403355897
MNSSAQDRKIAAESNKGHTILLLQFTPDDNSRTFLDYDDIYKCVDGLCQLYEQKLKVQNPGKQEVSYDVSELFTYLDTLKDLGCLVYNANIKGYEPKSRDWIKGQIYNALKGQAA